MIDVKHLGGLGKGFIVLLGFYFFSLIINKDLFYYEYLLFSTTLIKCSSETGLKRKIRRLSNKEKAEFTISQELKEILVGLLLGDLCAQKRYENGNIRLLFEQGEVHCSYLNHLYDLFKDYCEAEPKTSSRYN